MRNAVILHGTCDKEEYYDDKYPSLSNSHWLPWLQKQLLMNGIEAATPEVANAYEPSYDKWLKELIRFEITSESILVGHSCGGGFLVRWLSDNPEVFVKKVVLVAPWLDPKRTKTTDFFEFDIDPGITARVDSFTIFNSDNDSNTIQTSVRMIRDALPDCRYVELHNYGHFCMTDMKTQAFPELRDEIINGIN